MSHHDHATRHALTALRHEAALTHPKSSDAAVFAAEFKALAALRHAELAAARATIFTQAPSIYLRDGEIHVRVLIPDSNGADSWTDFARHGHLSVIDHGYKALRDLLILKTLGRARLAQAHCDRLFSDMARLEARRVVDKLNPAPLGWAALAERAELGASIRPAANQAPASRI